MQSKEMAVQPTNASKQLNVSSKSTYEKNNEQNNDESYHSMGFLSQAHGDWLRNYGLAPLGLSWNLTSELSPYMRYD